MEDLMGDGPVFGQIRSLAKPLAQFFTALKTVDQEAPVLFQAEHCIAGAAEENQVLFQQCAEQLFQCFRGGAAR